MNTEDHHPLVRIGLIKHCDIIVEMVKKPLPLKKHGVYYIACCPFHDEKTPSFFVMPQTKTYHCFGCGASGNAIDFLMAYEKLSLEEAIEKLKILLVK